ncbi:hypothetical protein [Ruegeria atlantica]|uniref:hypothetical protein n=1 Tax=Ruegeria atlantica TaxID=81569 RepID=UPI00249444E6|nr:hypothetical protein [Ruegeria atlantica]
MKPPLAKFFATTVNASLLLLIPQAVLSDEASSRVSSALERAYEGSRFDQLDASIDQCIVRFHRRDSEGCSQGGTIQANSYFVDLRHHTATYLDRYAREVNGEWRFRIELEPKGKWKTRAGEIDQEQDNLLSSARAQLGWGQHAAIAANEKFLLQNDVDSFHSLSTVEYCPMGQSQSPFLRPISLQGEIVDGLVEAFNQLMVDCSAI